MSMRRNAWAAAILLSIALMLASGCTPRNEYHPPPPAPVSVAYPLERMVTEYAHATGTTRAVNTVELRSRVSGYLDAIHFQDGDMVTEGQLLFEIDPVPYEAILASARAELAKSEAHLRLAEAQLARTQQLAARNATTADALDIDEAEAASAAADVEASQAAIRQAELNVEYTKIHAPITGRIGRHLVDIGNLVQVEQTELARIESVNPIHAYFTVNENDLIRLRSSNQVSGAPVSQGEPLRIEMGYGPGQDYPYSGTMDFREFGIDPTTGTTLRRAVFDNPEGNLLPGLFVRVRAAVGQPKPGLLVDERAIGRDQRGDYLLVVDKDDVVEYRPVTLGPADGGLRVISKGLNPGERVIVNGLQRARPGSKVTPEEVQMGAGLTSLNRGERLLLASPPQRDSQQ